MNCTSIEKNDPWKINFIDKMLIFSKIENFDPIHQIISRQFTLASFSIGTSARIYAERVDNLFTFVSGFLKGITLIKKRTEKKNKKKKSSFFQRFSDHLITFSYKSKGVWENFMFFGFIKKKTPFFSIPIFRKNFFLTRFCLYSLLRSFRTLLLEHESNGQFEIEKKKFKVDFLKIIEFQNNLQTLEKRNIFFSRILINSIPFVRAVNVYSNFLVSIEIGNQKKKDPFFLHPSRKLPYRKKKTPFLNRNTLFKTVDKSSFVNKKQTSIYSSLNTLDFAYAYCKKLVSTKKQKKKRSNLSFVSWVEYLFFKTFFLEKKFSPSNLLSGKIFTIKFNKKKVNVENSNIKIFDGHFYADNPNYIPISRTHLIKYKKRSYQGSHRINLVQQFIALLISFSSYLRSKTITNFHCYIILKKYHNCFFVILSPEVLYNKTFENLKSENLPRKKLLNFLICFLHTATDQGQFFFGSTCLSKFFFVIHL